MNPIEFFQDPAVATPLNWQGRLNIIAAVKEHFDAFYDAFASVDSCWIDSKTDIQAKLRLSGDTLISAFALAMDGKIGAAYDKFERGIDVFRYVVETWANETPVDQEERIRFFFRLRRSSKPLLQKGDLFHIPFDRRHIVETQRFSIPGIPCLYTSGSVYTCWEELGRPPFYELYGAAMWLAENESLRFLDLRQTAAVINNIVKHAARGNRLLSQEDKLELASRLLVNCVSIWPLIAICTIRVKERDGAFKPEYTIPQMVLQWIATDESIDGVAYQSTHVIHTSPSATRPLANYAFPSRDISDSGLCSSLKKKFRMTDPMPWPLLQSVRPIVDVSRDQYALNLHPALPATLMDTDFGHVEACLSAIGIHHARGLSSDNGTVK